MRVRTLEGHKSKVTSAAFSPDGKRIISGDVGGAIRLWDGESYREVIALQTEGDGMRQVAFSSDGRNVVAVSESAVVLWKAESQKAAKEDNQPEQSDGFLVE